MNVFDWDGPAFLAFYACAMAATFLLRHVLRRGAVAGEPELADTTTPLSPYELAYLAGGKSRALVAAAASLTQTGAVAFQDARMVAAADAALPTDNAPLEHALHEAARSRKRGRAPGIQALGVAAREPLTAIRAALAGRGLLPTDTARTRAVTISAVLLSALLLTGLVKIGVGLSRDRQVLYLVLMASAALLIGLVLEVRGSHLRTLAGDDVLEVHRKAATALHETAKTNAASLPGPEAALACGLFGVGALGAEFADVKRFAAQGAVHGGCGSADGGGGDGGCGGGGGCGGCGS